jgi:hypothetical protein
MSRWMLGHAEFGGAFRFWRFRRQRRDDAQGGRHKEAWQKEASISFHSFIFRRANLTVLCTLAFVCWGSDISRLNNPTSAFTLAPSSIAEAM